MMWNSQQLESAQRVHRQFMDYGRQTGRTTRMMKEAIHAATEGKTVLVIGANWQQLSHLQKMLQDARVGNEVEGNFIFSTVSEVLFRNGAVKLRERKVDPNNLIVLTDHYAQDDIINTLLLALSESRSQVEHYRRQQERTKMLVGELMGIWGQ